MDPITALLAIFDGIDRLTSRGMMLKRAHDEKRNLTDEEWDAIDAESDAVHADCKDAIRRARERQASSTA